MRWAPALALGALWWWGALRLALAPDAGVLEGAVAAGGWGLSLLPVHCVPKSRALSAAALARERARRDSAPGEPHGARGWRLRWSWRSWRSWRPWSEWSRRSGVRTGEAGKAAARSAAGAVTRAWRRRRSGGGSDPS
ncbi:hypothetical protein GCM10010277_82820 [Streptomyces longisporoflavus]|nr:hypothetical protein GCM10010277_82820 [Streptomyces longisporoflavus]